MGTSKLLCNISYMSALSLPFHLCLIRNMDVCKVLESQTEGTSIVLRIMFVQIEEPDASGQCTNDFMEIRDGKSGFILFYHPSEVMRGEY